ncbi:hypothetical protein QNE88_000648 [Vibrio alginolyticus]|uniref:phosphoribosyltransferase-like protein n=1 Tax=Vibrio alginolyticus TaxID=663 RepID=UPI0011EE0E69|nr:hypothetical protein [Vibrio alginolyticus]ELB2808745.1 hypothetical protein [Vibrio alginolyticus]TYZ35485.1 hypothetical protein EWT61_18025 [Vibrio alginolyticus]
MNQTQLCCAIASIISGYAGNRFGNYDADHVRRWANQFEESERQLVLEETLYILERQYITEEKFKGFVRDVIKTPHLHGGDPQTFWQNASLLQIQQHGNSQAELNDIFCSVLEQTHHVNGIINQKSSNYFYVDDFIFSGNRLYNDIKKWFEQHQPQDCKLNIVTIGFYTSGQYATKCKLEDLFKGKNITITFYRYDANILENQLRHKNKSERFWPTESVLQEPSIQAYAKEKGLTFQYRQVIQHSNKVFSQTRREEYERIMLKYGIKILGFPKTVSTVVKPLGYDTYTTFGFGSAVFTFRNCPNNNPLPFWWGNPNAEQDHPFRQWYPLLQRTAYRD